MSLLSIAEAIVSGVVSIPVDIYHGTRRTAEDVGLLGRDARLENQAERERLTNLIGEVFRNRNILLRPVEIILDHFFDLLPDDALQRMARAAPGVADAAAPTVARMIARSQTQNQLKQYIGRKIVERAITRAIAQRIAKFGVGIVLSGVLLQGMLERASNAAHSLRIEHPAIYQMIRNENLDMVYFLVEDFMKPYLDAIKLAGTNQAEFRRLVQAIESQINR